MYSMDSGLHISTSSPHRSSTVSGARPLLARPAVAIVFTSTRNDLGTCLLPKQKYSRRAQDDAGTIRNPEANSSGGVVQGSGSEGGDRDDAFREQTLRNFRE